MAKRTIKTGEAEVLYKTSKPVKAFDEKLHQLLDDMAETMYAADGVGLAAPQVGVLRRVVVIDCSEGRDELIEAVNPEIIETSGEQAGMEGCLSFPDEQGWVIRPNVAVMRAYDRDGNMFEMRGEGLLARAMLHECDHLDGRVYKTLVVPTPEGYGED
ncbi:MAG: peptide deformylase [Clostridia bacterium]|nr:peptide deformylase [Clostridia bacterium]MBQ4341641.1 peptide deformylase [Clostridia bacterium]